MSFLNPFWLMALPLILMPILIHLWNQRRHKTVYWGAMQFLLSAKRMSRGLARLRHWLIMAARMIVIAGLILTVARPLSTGWLGMLNSGQPDNVLILLDRSASMQQRQALSGDSKLRAGTEKIVAALETLGTRSRIYLVDSSPLNESTAASNANDAGESMATNETNSNSPRDGAEEKPADGKLADGEQRFGRVISIPRPRDLLELPEAGPTDASSDLPTMIQAAIDFMTANETGRTDLWICSDGAENDWAPESSRWQALQTALAKLEGVRIHFLNYSEVATENLSIKVDRWELVKTATQPELLIDLTIQRTEQGNSPKEIPVGIEIDGVRSELKVNLESESTTVRGHRIPLDDATQAGWGRVSLPADSHPSDNQYYFAFADPPPFLTVLVSPQPELIKAMAMAAAVPPQRGMTTNVLELKPERINELDWGKATLIVWQAALPAEPVAGQLTQFLARGGTVLFLPPTADDATSFAGWTWGEWKRGEGTGNKIGFWNSDDDLWMRTRDGQALPIDELMVYQHRALRGGVRELARLENGEPLLVRSLENSGSLYALTTLPTGAYSSLDREGISLYVLIQRALAGGAEAQGNAKSFDAGSLPALKVAAMRPVGTSVESGILTAKRRPYQAGVYQAGDERVALNRPTVEERSFLMNKDAIDRLFAGLDYHLISEQLNNERSLASEIWRLFVIAMAVALLVEAALSMPEKTVAKRSEQVAPSPSNRGAAA